MDDHISRRRLLKGLGLGFAGAGAMAHGSALQEMDAVEKQLAIKLSDEAKKLLKSSMDSNRQVTSARLRAAILPENSEPCFTFHSAAVKGRKP